MTEDNLTFVNADLVACTQCDRLLGWCRQVAQEKVKRFQSETYWGKPVPSFGDPEARLLVVGLAPAAHGANRTGRMFTGDRSGEWLYRALYRAGFANQPQSIHADDGLQLNDAYITAIAHCAPPENKPTPLEIAACRPFLKRELTCMQRLKVIVALGKLAFDQVHSAWHETHFDALKPKQARPKFGHGVETQLAEQVVLIGSYHPSQQNTFTGKLTEPMLDAIFSRAKEMIDTPD